MDRVLYSVMWLLVMGMIMGSGGAAIYLGWTGGLTLAAGQWQAGIVPMGVSLVLAITALLLCRHSNDLLDR